MLKNPIPIVRVSAYLNEVIIEISSKRLGATAVIDGNDQLVGIITDGDLRRMLEKNPDLTRVQASDIMTSNPKKISTAEYAIDALSKMKEFNITQLVAMQESQIMGFVHIHDLMKEGIV